VWQEARVQLFAICPPGLEPLLEAEVRALGLSGRGVPGGVEVEGDLAVVEKLNLHLRTATRVLLRIGQLKATNFPELIKRARALPWELCLRRGQPVALRVTCRKSRLYHSGAVAERLVLALEEKLGGKAPVVEKGSDEDEEAPLAQLVLARFERDLCTVSADTSGALLHLRGYRTAQSRAPLRETLAAAVLLAAGYSGEEPLDDPLCGSGTLAIEGAWIAERRAPGLARSFAFERWPGHDPRRWAALKAVAREGQRRAPFLISASDLDAGAVAATRANAARAGVVLELEQRALADLPARQGPGLIAVNPPYGVRVGEGQDLQRLHRQLGEVLRSRRPGFRLAALIADPRLAHAVGLPSQRLFKTQNGGLPVELLQFRAG